MFMQTELVMNGTGLVGNSAKHLGLAVSSSQTFGGGLAVYDAQAWCHRLYVVRNRLTSVGNAYGGGISITALSSITAVVVIRGSVVQSNTALGAVNAQGGGIYFLKGTLGSPFTLESAVLRNNTAQASGVSAVSAQGGGVYVDATVASLRGVLVADNSALLSGTSVSSVSALGGGVYCIAVLTLGRNSVVSGNRVLATVSSGSTTVLSQGGGVYQSGSTFVNSTIVRGNLAQFDGTAASSTTVGGGMAIASGLLEGRSLQLLNNMAISAGLSARGGGLWSAGSNVLMANCIVTGNVIRARQQSSGGGLSLVLSSASPVSLWRLRLCNNSAVAAGVDARLAQGGGLHVSQAARVTMAGSVVCDNRASITSSSAFQAGASGGGVYTTINLFCDNVNLTSNQAVVSGTSAVTEADAVGGGLYAQGTRVNLTRVLILNNNASQLGTALPGSSIGAGGGIFLNGTCRLIITTAGRSRMINNRAFSPYQRLGGLAYISRRTRFLVHSDTVTVFEGVSPSSTTVNTIHLEAGGLITQPSVAPTTPPSQTPTRVPTQAPSVLPTQLPTQLPSVAPTTIPSTVRLQVQTPRTYAHNWAHNPDEGCASYPPNARSTLGAYPLVQTSTICIYMSRHVNVLCVWLSVVHRFLH
jgi:hypothetical protein